MIPSPTIFDPTDLGSPRRYLPDLGEREGRRRCHPGDDPSTIATSTQPRLRQRKQAARIKGRTHIPDQLRSSGYLDVRPSGAAAHTHTLTYMSSSTFARRIRGVSPRAVFFLEVHEREDDGPALLQSMATPGQRPGGDAVRESSDGVGEDQPEVRAQRRR